MTEQDELQKLKRHLWIVTGLLGIVTGALVFQYATPVRVGGTVVEAEQFNLLAPDGSIAGVWLGADGGILRMENVELGESVQLFPTGILVTSPAGQFEVATDEQGLRLLMADSTGSSSLQLRATDLGGALALYGTGGSETLLASMGESAALAMVSPGDVVRVTLSMEGAGQRLILTDKTGETVGVIGFATVDGVDIPALSFGDTSGNVIFDALGTAADGVQSFGSGIDVTGTFIGTYAAESNPGLILQALLQLLQDGATVTGTLETDANRSATVTGSIEGSQLALKFTFTDECEGTATAAINISDDGTRLSGDYEADDCLGKYTGEFILEKQ